MYFETSLKTDILQIPLIVAYPTCWLPYASHGHSKMELARDNNRIQFWGFESWSSCDRGRGTCSKGCEFESQIRLLNGKCFNFFCNIFVFVWKDRKLTINKKRPGTTYFLKNKVRKLDTFDHKTSLKLVLELIDKYNMSPKLGTWKWSMRSC